MAHLNLLQCPKLRRANRWTPSPVNVKDIEMIRKKAMEPERKAEGLEATPTKGAVIAVNLAF